MHQPGMYAGFWTAHNTLAPVKAISLPSSILNPEGDPADQT